MLLKQPRVLCPEMSLFRSILNICYFINIVILLTLNGYLCTTFLFTSV